MLIKPVQMKDMFGVLMKYLPLKQKSLVGSEKVINSPSSEQQTDNKSLLLSLNGDLLEKSWAFETRQPINEVRLFGQTLNRLGIEHNCRFISEYGYDLVQAADNFNVDGMLKLIKKYKEKVEFLNLE